MYRIQFVRLAFCVCEILFCIYFFRADLEADFVSVCETHCVRVWLLQPRVSRVQSLEGALDLYSSFCSAAQRVCDLERVGHAFIKTKLLHTPAVLS